MSERFIKNYVVQGNDFRNSLVGQSDVIMAVAAAVIQSIKNGGKLIIFGNGGSAADAQHISSEFVSGYFSGGRPLPAIALTTNSSSLTAIANDSGYENIFARQLQSLARKGDVVIGISTSGSSANVLKALAVASEIGARDCYFYRRPHRNSTRRFPMLFRSRQKNHRLSRKRISPPATLSVSWWVRL